MMNNERLKEFMEKENILFFENYNLQYRTYAKTGGTANIFINVYNIDKFIQLLTYLANNNLDFKVIGATSNILFLDDVLYNIIISTTHLDNISFNDASVTVESGKSLIDFIRILHSKDIHGFEGLEGIPGTVGGALFMNAGAYGYTISDNLKNIKYFDLESCQVKNIGLIDLEFSSRNSIFRKNRNLIILEASFKIEEGNSLAIYEKVEQFHIARHLYQEFVYPNLGSIFTSSKSIYDELAIVNKQFLIRYSLLKKLFFNRVSRFINRKSPNRKKMNKLVESVFHLNKKDVYSIKNLNTFINNNKKTTEIIDYMYEIKSLLEDKVVIENEIILDSIDDSTPINKMLLNKINYINKGFNE